MSNRAGAVADKVVRTRVPSPATYFSVFEPFRSLFDGGK